MKCSHCGGEVLFVDGVGICQSCGNKHKIDNVFENVDVCICYRESDDTGKRTKDSIIAAEIYKKLEPKKISTFYERTSISNAYGDEAEMFRHTAMVHAEIVLLVGTTAERFSELYEKYSGTFNGKTIIPVICDMRPEELPDALKGLQVSNYNAIGALNNLTVSILNFLGRSGEIELNEIYGKQRRKKKALLIVMCSLLVVLIGALVGWFVLSRPEEKAPSVVSNEDIYKGALSLLEEERYLDAAAEFNKIIDYKDSAFQAKTIYDRYDGYYVNNAHNVSLNLDIIDSKTIELIFEKTKDKKVLTITEVLTLQNNSVSGSYIDSVGNRGQISMQLYDQAVEVHVSTTSTDAVDSFGELSIQFSIQDKTDRPTIKTPTKTILLSWVKSGISVDDIKMDGYDLEYIDTKTDPYNFSYGTHYKVANTNITLVTTQEDLTKVTSEEQDDIPMLDKSIVVAVLAPAKLICSDKIGTRACPFVENEILFVPNASGCFEGDSEGFTFDYDSQLTDPFMVDKNGYVGLAAKKQVGEYIYSQLLSVEEQFYKDLYISLVEQQLHTDFPNIAEDTHIPYKDILAKKDEVLLVCIHIRESRGLESKSEALKNPGTYYYYRLDLKTEKSSLVVAREGVSYINDWGSVQYSYEEWKKEPEAFWEFFPDRFEQADVDAGKLSSDFVMNTLYAKAIMLTYQQYPQAIQEAIAYETITENDTYALIVIITQSFDQDKKCAWYKGNKNSGEVLFLREGPYVEESLAPGEWTSDSLRIAEYLWFKEYPDFAEEFPELYGTPDQEGAFYTIPLPYMLKFSSWGTGYAVFEEPSHNGERVGNLPDSNNVLVITDETYDEEYNVWGKLESGEGWVCLSKIWEEASWEIVSLNE